MEHAGRRLIVHLIPGPVQAERKVHVLEISTEALGKSADPEEDIAAIEGARPAGAEDRTRLQKLRGQQLAVTTLARDAAEIIAVPGTIDRWRLLLGSRAA